ncbi:efflux RND transporter periplasmic adaptor subunit [Candidatus Electrothrix sp.]|uniref:efflux RND transporter periplasmic adaptor subunit n=1 Tax=Candidatus Electrothrix sp. TaxID=2170559 RepID=UPI0040575BA4
MNAPTPKTLRGKIVWFLLKILPGLVFVLILLAAAFLIQVRVDAQKAARKEELKNSTSVEAPPTNVVTLELKPTTLQDKINLPGLIEPWTKLALMSKIGGTIEELAAQEGDYVQKGQLIARLESKDYRIALDSAKAAYALAQADYSRNKALRKKGISTQANLDEQYSKLRQTKAALENAELALSRCRVTAPISGIISRIDAEVGMVVNQMMPEPIAEILQIDRVKAVVGIPEADVNAARQLQQTEVHIRSLENARFLAQVHFLAPAPESMAHAYRFELALDNPDEKILPGMFLQANIVKQTEEQAVAVPLYTIISRNDEHFVYVVENNIAHKRAVETGFTEGWQILIRNGLHLGEKVIIQGHRTVEDGQKVRVVKKVDDLKEFMP